MIARERSDQGDLLIYDLEITDDSGVILERWDGLRLRVVERDEPRRTWPAPLLGPYLERTDEGDAAGVPHHGGSREERSAEQNARSDRLLQRALGRPVPIRQAPRWQARARRKRRYRGVGGSRPRPDIAVAGPGTVTCDIEPAIARSGSLWRDLLGPDGGNSPS